MSIKKYSSGSWVTVPYRKYETATDTITSLPQTIIGDGQNISAYTIKGNMTQSGTPTPSNPIYPQECGDLVTTGEHAGEYEIPILSNGVSYPIYLSEPIRKRNDSSDTLSSSGTVSRVIKTISYDGTETWSSAATTQGGYRFYCSAKKITDADLSQRMSFICTHFAQNGGDWNRLGFTVGTDGNIFYVVSDIDNTTDWKAWLAELKSNGTPLTTYYILATATTETFTAPTIPTSGTAQSLDVDTSLKPSEVSLTYHGWHEHEDTKFTT